jgi:hypothetical protein
MDFIFSLDLDCRFKFEACLQYAAVISRCAVARLICSNGNAHDATGRFVCLDIFCYCVVLLDVRSSIGIPSVYIHQSL